MLLVFGLMGSILATWLARAAEAWELWFYASRLCRIIVDACLVLSKAMIR